MLRLEHYQLNDGRTVLAKNDKKYGLTAITYANRTLAHKAAERLREQGIEADVVGWRPFYVQINKTEWWLPTTAATFQEALTKLADRYGKPLMEIARHWREYSAMCNDQSAVLSEFENWFGPRWTREQIESAEAV